MVEKEHQDLEAIAYLSRIIDLRTRRGISLGIDRIKPVSGFEIQKLIKLLEENPSQVRVDRNDTGVILGFEILD